MRALEASIRLARRRGLVGPVSAVVWDQTVHRLVTWPEVDLGVIDSWVVVTDWAPVDESTPDLILVVDVTTTLAPSCLSELLSALDDPSVGIVEPRRIPFQSRKPVDLATGNVSWASAGCCLVRRDVLVRTGGFDRDLFPDLGADVDMSWRARLAGWSVRSVPTASALDRTSPLAGEAILEPSDVAALAKLRLAARYSGPTLAGAWAMAWSIRGRPGERVAAERAAAETAAVVPLSDLDGRSDPLLQELFQISGMAGSGHGKYDLVEQDVRPGASPPPAPEGNPPFLSVVVRTQGTRLAELEDNLLSLACQGCWDFEVLLMEHDLDEHRKGAIADLVRSFPQWVARRVRQIEVSGGGRARPLNEAIELARGRYVAFLDDDDVALPTWVGEFHRVTESHPGAVAWTRVAWQFSTLETCAGRPFWKAAETPQLFVRDFDVFAHLTQNETTNCAVAIPLSLLLADGMRFREDLSVFEDWEMILRLAQRAPFQPTENVTALYRRGSPDNSGVVHDPSDWEASSVEVIAALDQTGFFVRGEHLARLRDDLAELAALRRELSEQGGAEDPPPVLEHGEATVLEDEFLAGRRVAVVSPHLDDAVLSCGAVMSAMDTPVVITVFAGNPGDWSELSGWDALCGYAPGTDVVEARRIEDDEALSCLGARGIRLNLLDEQYRSSDPQASEPRAETVGREILGAIRGAGVDTVFVPLGLGHTDHRLTREACVWVIGQAPELDWFAYQDLPYAYEVDGVDEALAGLESLRPDPVRLPVTGDLEIKSKAVDCYTSQLIGLGSDRRALALRPERFWRLVSHLPDGELP